MAIKVASGSLRSAEVRKAILLYYGSGGVEYATIHRVEVAKSGQPVVRAGAPVDRRTLIEMSKGLMRSRQKHVGLLPPNVLSIGTDFLAWWIPPRQHAIYFNARQGDDKTASVGQRNGIVPHPGLIFVVQQRSCFVFAVKGRNRPNAETEVYRSPYFNVWEDGKVCTGNVKLPNAVATDRMAAWEDSFFYSNFTHTNVRTLVTYKGGAHAFWTDMLDGAFRRFPERVLIPFSIRNSKKTAPLPLTVAGLLARFEDNCHA